MRGRLTAGKVFEIVDLYLTGQYTYQMVADLTGLSHSLVCKVMVFSPPYAHLSALFSDEKLQRLAQVRRERKCANKLDPPTVRKIRRVLARGGYGTKQELADIYEISRETLYRIERRIIHDYAGVE